MKYIIDLTVKAKYNKKQVITKFFIFIYTAGASL